MTDSGEAECEGERAGLHFTGQKLTGVFDTLFLSAYAAGLFVSGPLADRSNLRLYLAFGMLGVH
jgi:sugar phosphate permease